MVCFNDKCKDVIEEVKGHKVYRVATWINVARQALSLSYFWVLKKAIKEFKPDVIQFHRANIFKTYNESSNRTRMACHSRWL